MHSGGFLVLGPVASLLSRASVTKPSARWGLAAVVLCNPPSEWALVMLSSPHLLEVQPSRQTRVLYRSVRVVGWLLLIGSYVVSVAGSLMTPTSPGLVSLRARRAR